MMFRRIIILYNVLLICSNFTVAQENNLLNYPNSVKYANYLFENKEYELSAIEYERIVFMEPADTLAKLRLVQSYRLMNDFKTALNRLEGFYPCCLQCCNSDFAFEKFRIHFHEKQYDECLQLLSDNKHIDLTTGIKMKTAVLLMQNKWNEATKTTDNYLSTNSSTPALLELKDISLKGATLQYKNPYTAAIFSGIIPGSGKFYTHQWKDGLYAMLAVSALSYITYQSFAKNGSNPYGYIFGTVAFSFYTANIYGSFKSAVRFNKTKNAETVRDVEKLIFEKK